MGHDRYIGTNERYSKSVKNPPGIDPNLPPIRLWNLPRHSKPPPKFAPNCAFMLDMAHISAYLPQKTYSAANLGAVSNGEEDYIIGWEVD